MNSSNADPETGLVGYTHGQDNSISNPNDKDRYFSSEVTPAYAHSFLLTGILSSDYTDVTGNGISDDDLGDAVEFKYTKVYGSANPFKWKTPNSVNKATHNQNLKTILDDDKGSYIYGEKEMWYMHMIESKTMIATFKLENREDLYSVDEQGNKILSQPARRLKEINLYSKADFMNNQEDATPIKTVHFAYSYSLCIGANGNEHGKLTLDSIYFSYNDNVKKPENPYVFNYKNNKAYQQKSYDRWGNFKEREENPGNQQSGYLHNDDFPYVVQDSLKAAENASAWALDSIVLPSGGAIKVDYESDDYAYVQNKRAMQMFTIAGFGNTTTANDISNKLYSSSNDNLYIYIDLPNPVNSESAFFERYIKDIKKLYFKLRVKVPGNDGGGYEFVSGYCELENENYFGLITNSRAWLKMKGISADGTESGNRSPMSKTALQFLRLNLPSQAFPGSEVGDQLSPATVVMLMVGLSENIIQSLTSFDNYAKNKPRPWMQQVDVDRSFVRLHNPDFKRMGGGHRVKRITIYDHWEKMTGNRGAVYGQEYDYTTQTEINGVKTLISSGVASYEPGLGGDENPFHLPIEYLDKAAILGPTNMMYSEEPMGESLFPSPGVGYSKVRTRTINYKDKKSANGIEESQFFTTYDFPTLVDRTVIDRDTKKRFKPDLSNFLRINAHHHMVISQGFKIELNDMNGKLKAQATYAENSQDQYITYTENFYKVENQNTNHKKLTNEVIAINPQGLIDSAAIIGKDVELMVSMRQQKSVSTGSNVNLNGDLFTIVPPLLFFIPTVIGLYQREENLYRSAATVKIINRYGILDSIIHIDKGSKISTKNLLFDCETGDVLLSRTQNEFNDPIFNFTYPAHWKYNEMGPAYQNINASFYGVTVRNGKVTSGLSELQQSYFVSGDEIFVAGKVQTGDAISCEDIPYSAFPSYTKIWAIDSSVINGGTRALYFIDEAGTAYNGNDVYMKIIRSGRRNIAASIGSVTSLVSPLQYNGSGQLELAFDENSQVVNTSAVTYKDKWQVENILKQATVESCVEEEEVQTMVSYPETCNCILPLMNYIVSTKKLFTQQSQNVTIGSLVNAANLAGFSINLAECPDLLADTSKLFYALSTDSVSRGYRGKFGDCNINFRSDIHYPPINFNQLDTAYCNSEDNLVFSYTRYEYCYTFHLNAPTQDFSHLEPNDPLLDYSFTYITCSGDSATQSGSYSHPTQQITLIDAVCAKSVTGTNILIDSIQICSTVADVDPVAFYIDSCYNCVPDTIAYCYSPITDTTLNPYSTGILGNWRVDKSYVYYDERNESDPQELTNIRTNGTIKEFAPFWSFNSGQLENVSDTTKWVWNSMITMVNRKGLEIENKDPLGRYNAGLYGYNLTMPVAVVQNSRYRESGFDGFEDYDFNAADCNLVCETSRHLDFTNYKHLFVTDEKHSGKRSLMLSNSDSAGISMILSTLESDTASDRINFTTQTDSCATTLKSIDIDAGILLPILSPVQGQKMVLSAWVKEAIDCQCNSYQNNSIVISYEGNEETMEFYPSGNIIEGWQRYDVVFTIPENAMNLNVTFKSKNGATVYFDDFRIHPYNANMKSFVFDPTSLRLMAELDENNYATFYEYDDDGTLIRLKKETRAGIKTIKETRSALIKKSIE